MKISVTLSDLHDLNVDLLALAFSKSDLKKKAPKALAAAGISSSVLDDFKAGAGELMLLYPADGKLRAQRVALVGTGEGKTIDDWRKAAVEVASKAAALEVSSVAFDITGDRPGGKKGAGALAEAVAEGACFGNYRFERLKSGKLDKEPKKADAKKGMSSFTLRVEPSLLGEAEKGAEAGRIVGEAQSMARDMINLPGNYLQAEDLSKIAVESGKKYGYAVTVLRKKEIEALKMGGLLAVNQGSTHPPTFTVMDYKPKGKARAVVALVGKGVTFDSGGISIKPSEGMGEMKSDMAGAAAVIGAVEAAARLALPVRVIGLVPSTDNMPDGSAQKPGDVITTYSGITVEVGNTDAEGRLILADALSYAKEKYSPDVLIDVATLTGACIVALGYRVAGIFSNSDTLAAEIGGAGELSGEKVWRLPLWDLYDEQIQSDVADVNNTGGRGAGTITAAKFLQKFTDGHKKWAHIDIAGPSFSSKGSLNIKGGTGFGVRLLVELMKQWK